MPKQRMIEAVVLGSRVFATESLEALYPSESNVKYPINDRISDHPFTDYWDVFVLKHQHPVNIALHGLGIAIFYGWLITLWQFRNPWLLLGWPLPQLVGLAGHLLFERSHIDWQDAVFSWRASSCLGRMLWRIAIGRYRQDIRERQEQLRAYQKKVLTNS